MWLISLNVKIFGFVINIEWFECPINFFLLGIIIHECDDNYALVFYILGVYITFQLDKKKHV